MFKNIKQNFLKCVQEEVDNVFTSQEKEKFKSK